MTSFTASTHEQNFDNTVARMIAAHAAVENYTLSHQELIDYLSALEFLGSLMKEATAQLSPDTNCPILPI